MACLCSFYLMVKRRTTIMLWPACVLFLFDGREKKNHYYVMTCLCSFYLMVKRTTIMLWPACALWFLVATRLNQCSCTQAMSSTLYSVELWHFREQMIAGHGYIKLICTVEICLYASSAQYTLWFDDEFDSRFFGRSSSICWTEERRMACRLTLNSNCSGTWYVGFFVTSCVLAVGCSAEHLLVACSISADCVYHGMTGG